ncbi:MAG TPA: acyltransferase [Candidatus Limnocylindrales bacterium]|nr:acyltransferase [Candidatus Limnocylindrales bacterium]
MALMRDGRIATIDGLRGIAILLVVWFHVWQITWQSVVIPGINLSLQPLAETGFLGVALFFFISGFVLMLPYAQARIAGTPPHTWGHFYWRRFVKIVPSYVLCIVAMIAFGYQTYPDLASAVKDVGIHLLFVHTWFAATYGSINAALWSLAVEVQFYALFPLIAIVFVRRPLLTAIALFAIANAWRVWCMLSSHTYYEMKLAQLPAYVDFFAAGMLGAWICATIAVHRPHFAEKRLWFSLLMIAGFVGFWLLAKDCYDHRYDPEWPQLWVVQWRSALALVCLAAAVGAVFAARRLQLALANPVLLFLAVISYNLYLFHPGVAHGLLVAGIPPHATADPHDDRTWQLVYWLVAIPAMLIVASAITYGFERPLLRLRAPRLPRRIRSQPAAPEQV